MAKRDIRITTCVQIFIKYQTYYVVTLYNNIPNSNIILLKKHFAPSDKCFPNKTLCVTALVDVVKFVSCKHSLKVYMH